MQKIFFLFIFLSSIALQADATTPMTESPSPAPHCEPGPCEEPYLQRPQQEAEIPGAPDRLQPHGPTGITGATGITGSTGITEPSHPTPP